METTRWLEFAPPQASNFAPQVDAFFYSILALCLVLWVITSWVILHFVNKYRRGRKADRTNPIHDHAKVEAIWTLTPIAAVVAIFVWSTIVYIRIRSVPKHAYEVFVVGKQWMWQMQHPNGIRENSELTVPIGQPVKLTMISQDVIHAFYVPAFRLQYAVIPGRYTTIWFTPTKIGSYHLFCNMLCGTQHSDMIGKVNILSPADFARWLEKGGNRFQADANSVAEKGKILFTDMKCGTCHLDHDTANGPSLSSIFMSKRALTNGTAVADEDYLRESIIQPWAKVTKGYEMTMPEYTLKEAITEEQIRQLIEYMKTLAPKTGVN